MTFHEFLSGLPVIAGLIVIEGLLSVDNVLGIAALAKELPEHQQKRAIRLGLAGAYLFRVLALLVAGWLTTHTWVRWLGAGYLIWLMCSHLTRHSGDEADGKVTVIRATFAGILFQISLMDLSLSIDNVIAAVALAPKNLDGSLVMWPIYAGVGIAILALQAIAPHAVKLLQKFPVLEPTAFILIGFVGGILIYEETAHLITGEPAHISPYFKFVGILAIIWLALLYDADGSVQRIFRPVVAVAKPLMKTFTAAVNLVFLPITLIFARLKSRPPDVVD